MVDIQKVSTLKVPTAFEKLLAEYVGGGALFEIAAHHYFSTGAFRWQVLSAAYDQAGFWRAIIRCPQGSKIDFFSYGVEDDIAGVGLSPNFNATDSETNLAERHQTNNEDYAIEGIGAASRGTRIAYPLMQGGSPSPLFTADSLLARQVIDGDMPWCDLGAQLLPPEVASPLALHDTLYAHIAPFVSLQPSFDRKSGDHICRLDRVPQAGAASYLKANGEPSWHNYYRIPEGYVWRKSSEKTDRLLALFCTVEQDVYATVTLPLLWQPPVSSDPRTLGQPTFLWTEFSIFLIGRAFYNPSANV